MRLSFSLLLLAGALTAVVVGTPVARTQAAAVQSNCATLAPPASFPFGPDDPAILSTNFHTSTRPAIWWVPPAYTFNQYTVHAPGNVLFTPNGLELTNSPDHDGTQQDLGITGEGPVLGTNGRMSTGTFGDSMLMAWCARVTDDAHIDTDFEIGQKDSKPWPPEIDLAEGAGNVLTVIFHWTCDASIPGCPKTDGYFNGKVASTGSYKPWPPPGTHVGSHYFCNTITNGSGHQVYNNPSDGHYDYNCRAEINLPLPPGGSVTQWNEYGAEFNPSNSRLSVWIDDQRPVVVTDRVCGANLLFDDNGVLPIGQIENGGASEPCLQVKGNWQWDVQQTEWEGIKTVAGLTPGQHDTADVAWWSDYVYQACPPSC
jgi:hypothetical protein